MKVILLCGKICSGKSYYAEQLVKNGKTILLSCDEAFASIFPESLDDDEHDIYVDRVKAYLYRKSVDLVKAGLDVVLDFGFWSKAERTRITKYYKYNNIDTEWHYIDVSDEQWVRNIERRNRRIREGLSTDYYLDDDLREKMMNSFEPPEREEIDVWYENKD